MLTDLGMQTLAGTASGKRTNVEQQNSELRTSNPGLSEFEVQRSGIQSSGVSFSKPGHPTCTTHEIAAATNIDERTVRYHAKQGKYGEPVAAGTHIYLMGQMAASLRSAIESLREEHALGTAPVVNCSIYQYLPQDFSESELALARQKANFVLAVYRYLAAHGGTKPDACRRVVEFASKQHPFAFTNDGGDAKTSAGDLLLSAGHNGQSALRLDGMVFPAYENFQKWAKVWAKLRRHDLDDFQYWVLCRRQRVAGAKRKEQYQRPGDPRFWTAFANLFETSQARGADDCYREAAALATKAGLAVPSLRVVRWYYQEKMPAAERRRVYRLREGKKAHYDKKSIYILRDWRRVNADDWWSFDGHKLDVWVKMWDPLRQGFVPERPWLVNAIDSCSWYEVGRCFTFVPAQDTVELAIRNAFKRYHRAPGGFYFDNGREFKAAGKKLVMDEARLNEVCDNLNIEAMYALPYNPRAKVNERDYRNVVNWFERRQPTYSGNAAISKSNFDQRWHELHKPGAPLECDSRGCLLHPELVPSLEEISALYDAYRSQEHHQRVRQGKICPNQSPAAKYLAAPARREMTADEVALSFLRDMGRQKVDSQARVFYKPPGCRADETLAFQDPALMNFEGRYVVVKYDIAEQRCFAFQELKGGKDHVLIKGEGEFGSLPLDVALHPFDATQEEIRGKKRFHARLQRTERTGRRAGELLDASRELAKEVAADRGVTTGRAATFINTNDDVVARAAKNAERDQRRKKIMADLDAEAQITNEDRAAYETGRVQQ